MKSHLLSPVTRVCVSIVVLCVLLSWVGGTALADPIPPGFDYLHTPPGGGQLPIPGGPTVPLRGRAIGPGNTDTIIERLGGLPDGGVGPIDAEIVALSLESISPVDLGGSFFDVFVDLNPAVPSPGMITVTSHSPGPDGGGTFDSFFDVFARVTLTEVGNPSNTMVLLTQDRITSSGSDWSHRPPPNYPGPGGFVPGVLLHTGPHPHTEPATPEPASALLLVIGALGLGLFGQARRR